jgi:energy-coupling factor transporter ATP-binding protein EcfA2
MYVRTLTIKNLRCFEKAQVSLNHPGLERRLPSGLVRHLPNVTLLLGDNGSGKTTVLRAIVLGALAPVMAMGSGYVPFSLVRRVKGRPLRQGRVETELLLNENEVANLRETSQHLSLRPLSGYNDLIQDFEFPFPDRTHGRARMFEERLPGYFILGYGASRRAEPSRNVDEQSRYKERTPKYLRVAGLFEENVTLMPLSNWLPAWRTRAPHRHREIVGLINRMLPGARLLDSPRDREYLFRMGGSELPFAALSDGYRAHIAWISDLLYHLSTSCPPRRDLIDLRGVVLVDEIDLHFHPQWQRDVIPTVAQALPNLQFIVTTHSPIVTGTLSSANILLIRDRVDKRGITHSVIEQPDEEMYGRSADQILTSNIFGLESTRDARFFQELQNAARKARDSDPAAALRFMRMVSGGPAAVEPVASPPSKSKGALVRRKQPAARSSSTARKRTLSPSPRKK